MAFCPQDCVDDTLVPLPSDVCDPKVRKRGIDRIGFFPCTLTLPEPMTCDGLTPLVVANSIVFSSRLALITVNDPEQEELEIADCIAPLQTTVRRTIDFQDRIAVENVVASPGVNNLFADYDFWKDKKTKSATMRYFFVMCDGSVQIAKDDAGNYMEATLNVFLSFERQSSGGNAYTLEIKKGQLIFKGDPMDFVKPETDTFGNIFNINPCAIL